MDSRLRLDPSSLIDIRGFEGGYTHHRFLEEALKQRLEVIKHLTLSDIEKVAEALGGELVDFKIDASTEWVLRLSPFKGFDVYFVLQRYSPEFEDRLLAFYNKEAPSLGVPAEDASDFTVLYANAIIYAAKRLLSKELPKISRYL
ncbi:MAG: hypothetical protein N3H31_00670 [Candidatus Nezhaarchaeota archaeon]|nr:hypothetical protein [Candidatus Nezhaarchaeota archaeon]